MEWNTGIDLALFLFVACEYVVHDLYLFSFFIRLDEKVLVTEPHCDLRSYVEVPLLYIIAEEVVSIICKRN